MANQKIIIALTAMLFIFVNVQAQLTTNSAATPQTAVQTLLGEGVNVTNINFTGPANQIGTFGCINCGLGFGSGTILATGNIDVALGPNNSTSQTIGGGNFGVSDPDLAILNPNVTFNDAVSVEFDFVAQGDSVAFNYVFGSEEYPEYSGSGFNDAFGFFLSGPGINGPYTNNGINIALIPGTGQAVSINNVNAGTNDLGCTNCAYYVVNTNNNSANGIQFDGYTIPLVASYNQLICGETYHIRIAIADAGDTSFDSAVFFEENSFYLEGLDVELIIPQIGLNDSTIYEGCGISYFQFTRLSDIFSEQSFMLEVSGTALPDVDYPALPTEIVFPIGIPSVQVPFSAFPDAITEGLESVTITYTGQDGCGESEEQTVTFYIGEPEPLVVELEDVPIDCGETATLSPTISGGYGVYSIEWFNGSTDFSIEVSPGITTAFDYIISDTCSVSPINGLVTVDVPVYPPLAINTGGPIEINCLEIVSVVADVSGGNGEYFYSWQDPQGNELSTTAAVQYDPDLEGSIPLTVIDGCGVSVTEDLEFTFYDIPLLVNLPNSLEAPCLDVLNVVPTEVSGGIGNYSYTWEVGGLPAGFLPQVSVTIGGDVFVELTVEDQCGNIGTDNVTIEMTATPVNLVLPTVMDVNCLGPFVVSPTTLQGGVGIYTYTWESNGGTVASTQNLATTISENTLYTLTVEDGCGNVATDQTQVNLIPEIITVDLGPDLFVPCQENILVDPIINGGFGPFDYAWTSNQLDAGSGSTLSLIANGFIPVILNIEDQCGNTGSGDLFITIPTTPPQLIISNDTTICLGMSRTLQLQIVDPIGSYDIIWLPGYSGGQTLTVSPNETTSYSVYVEDQCGNSSTANSVIHVEWVKAKFDFDYTDAWGVETYNASEPSDSYFVWDFDDGEISNEFEPVHIFSDNYAHNITLYAVSPGGCVDSIGQTFYPFIDLFVPSAFTPDNDGVNDYFLARGHDIRYFEITIFNRWGDIVFHSNDIDEPWVGDNSGSDYFVQNEIYTYVVEAVGIRQDAIVKKGTITVVR
jgi:gliding motility-associated-like protein